MLFDDSQNASANCVRSLSLSFMTLGGDDDGREMMMMAHSTIELCMAASLTQTHPQTHPHFADGKSLFHFFHLKRMYRMYLNRLVSSALGPIYRIHPASGFALLGRIATRKFELENRHRLRETRIRRKTTLRCDRGVCVHDSVCVCINIYICIYLHLDEEVRMCALVMIISSLGHCRRLPDRERDGYRCRCVYLPFYCGVGFCLARFWVKKIECNPWAAQRLGLLPFRTMILDSSLILLDAVGYEDDSHARIHTLSHTDYIYIDENMSRNLLHTKKTLQCVLDAQRDKTRERRHSTTQVSVAD